MLQLSTSSHYSSPSKDVLCLTITSSNYVLTITSSNYRQCPLPLLKLIILFILLIILNVKVCIGTCIYTTKTEDVCLLLKEHVALYRLLQHLFNHMHFITTGYKRLLQTNSSDPRQRVPLISFQTSFFVFCFCFFDFHFFLCAVVVFVVCPLYKNHYYQIFMGFQAMHDGRPLNLVCGNTILVSTRNVLLLYTFSESGPVSWADNFQSFVTQILLAKSHLISPESRYYDPQVCETNSGRVLCE